LAGEGAVIASVLHIGAGKCGSSALQTMLSQHPVLGDEQSSRMRYAAINKDGMLFHGSALTHKAQGTPWGYLSTVNVGLLASLADSHVRKLSDELHSICGNSERLLLSNEGWINEYKVFKESDLLTRLGLKVTVVVYVRPPVEWLNSAWWQWGAWSGVGLDQWLNNQLAMVRWHDMISPWLSLQNVEKVTVRLLPSDVISDFCDVMNLPRMPSERSNRGLPGTLLRIFQRHRDLRTSPHDSAGDFVFAKYLGHLTNDPTPWVMGPYRIRKILEATKESNLRLLSLLDDDSRKVMEEEGKWWLESAYSDKKKSFEGVVNQTDPHLEQITVAALSSLLKLENENRDLRNRLKKLSQKSE